MHTMKHYETFIYTPQIPTGTARTRGYGETRNVYVVRCEYPENFRSLNSLTRNRVGWWSCKWIGQARFDYGLKYGRSAQLLKAAENWVDMLSCPDERTTKEEF